MRAARLVLASCLTVAMMTVGLSSPASAAFTERCEGFADCTGKGYSNFGYEAVYTKRHWDQNSGHNCTNYVAYRLAYNGRITARVPQTGNASSWDNAVRKWKRWGAKVVKTPRKGDIAYWEGGYHGAGRQGHVAYVERVFSDGAIDVSEDNASGDFRWIKYSGSNKPSGYLRFYKSVVSPRGQIKVSSPQKRALKVSGYVTDANAYGKPIKLQVRVYAKNKKSYRKFYVTARAFQFSASFTSSKMLRGKRLVRTYAYNAGGSGKTARIDSRYVKIK